MNTDRTPIRQGFPIPTRPAPAFDREAVIDWLCAQGDDRAMFDAWEGVMRDARQRRNADGAVQAAREAMGAGE